jgi:Beta-xylosidase
MNGALQDVHDPAIIRAHGQYYLYSTGGGIQWRSSSNRTVWGYGGDVLGGVATNPVLSPDSAAYEWTDRGKVIESYNSDPYNAIDPNVITDEEGRLWMAFGSWNDTGIRMRRLNPDTGKPSSEDETVYSLANRPNADENAIEAPYIIWCDEFYYLFVSFDHCCWGVDSDYNIRVGRSRSVTGPHVDEAGIPMRNGGGTLVLNSWARWKGPGHNAVLKDGGETFLVYHAYSVADGGTPVLKVSPLEWENGWPFVSATDSP